METSDIIPTLRFPKSRGRNRWVVSTIGEIFESLPTASYSRAYLSEEGSIGYIHYGDIHTKYNSYIDLSKVKLPSIPVELKKKYRFVKDGDLVLTDASEDYLGIGKAVEIINVGKHKTICGLHTILLRETQHVFCVGFKTYLFQSPTVKKQIERLSVGFKVNSISYNAIKDIRIAYPDNKQEQEKISKCLQTIETEIRANVVALNKMLQHKKALLQNLFPQRGEVTPNKCFNDSDKKEGWRIKFGGDLFYPVSNKNHQFELPILAISQGKGAIPRDEINYRVSVSEKSIEGYKVVEVGDFIISLRSFQGGIEYSRYRGLCSPAYVVLRKKTDNLYDDFYRHYFKTTRFIQDLTRNLEGIRDGKMISFQQFSEIRIPYPSYEEQQKIADILTSLDKIIELKKRKIELLKLQEKGLLQQLFPQSE